MTTTEKVKHTGGPWKYAPLLDRITEPNGQEVARTYAGPWDAEVEDANARLIAASPEMLSALEECIVALTLYDTPPHTSVTNKRQALEGARAAIRRAKGE